ncbi:S-layer homology domain-containing protein [uncultured Dialister sp.]|uniref:S-layer homology domain-containing protein n=1 Tax=Dialister hominis TaxID=2582419 RepID=UPI002670030F|nr:S-layer homology domain-containing protein [uncultured Dialister sp.]
MKKILAIAAVAALSAGVSAYAANPFSDVTPSDWAYQAVVDLSDQGVVEGYPDGTFKGERNITRYEMAQIIARMLAKEDQLNAEQRATLDKLAGEYADELANLGVRVANLEKKVGNLSFSGNGRMRYNQSYGDNGKAADKWDGRMQVNIKGQVNDSTYVLGRLRYDMNFKSTNEDPAYLDQLIVHHDFGDKASVNIGKIDLFLGQTGVFFDSEIKGAELAFHANDAANLAVGYGRFEDWNGDYADNITDKHEYAYAQFSGEAGRFAYDVDYVNGTSTNKVNIWGAGLTAGLGGGFDVFGDYYKNTDAKGDPDLWTAGLGYGKQDNAKVGSFRVAASYVDAERNAFLGAYTYDASPLDALLNKEVKEVKFWRAEGDVTLAKNVRLHGEYSFDVKTKGTDTDYDDVASVSLNYVF